VRVVTLASESGSRQLFDTCPDGRKKAKEARRLKFESIEWIRRCRRPDSSVARSVPKERVCFNAIVESAWLT
jgi:hypothetical protein